jgi:hypothetical protein
VDTGPGLYFHNTDVDSRRLQEAFFSSASSDSLKDLPKKRSKKPLIWLITTPIVLIALFTTYIVFSYDFVFIPKTPLPTNAIELLNKPDLLSISAIGSQSIKTAKSSLHIPLTRSEKTGLALNFKKNLNLNTHDIVLTVQNNLSPTLMQVAIKDALFYSNIKQPERIVIDKTESNSLFTIPLNLSENISSKVNLSKVQQIKLFFQVYDGSAKKLFVPADPHERQIITIKNILLVKKEG